ncbi:dihydrolipoamide acetyltransferase component of pyruvate dehydrogenase complex [Virgibacillus pantothenticus]|uniref:dihydrolipoamide acetyltransferase family protein n=1 Tax=Virgibacillus pantothenticus TaxID=1473 RepID=UPI001B091473|nr:dihydrolipoamide acetyltransferase family protein [Virgibacillus pantothenticus]MBU8564877.1 2-oxo acid dehydrogenase subunit E2 [Virgibacillus pantothenticus]MBU8599185.1 2-oxo acid dehydrogenase subunit E2 [Virgibacillus pantothenticus]MBU8633412.1 2-oxo acid dehydrogenase subunit E2 [Virgibacillus pantothenticus]MBU8640927.1 2-oxo acid dehydrogenase subunit E2 [Virgibacillus pantothenticus]MBU8645144.1 2-oxo acid dehydrogenase subunit E2 [Virgibacillus pantothenticus]
MATSIVMPKLGMTMTEGTVEEWLKQPGDTVKEGEGIVTISSDKLTSEVEAPADGVLLKIIKDVTEEATVGEPIGIVGQDGEEVGEAVSNVEETKTEQEPEVHQETIQQSELNQKMDGPQRKKRISPAARKKAKALAIDISNITGTGPKGRITRRDIEQAAKQQAAATIMEEQTVEKQTAQEKATHVTGLSSMRKSIATNMQQSLANTAQLTLHRKADITDLLVFQNKMRAEAAENGLDIKLTLTVFLARAVTLSLQQHPEVNTHLIDEQLHQYDVVHLGIATSLENGLVVPVVKHAERLPLGSLAEQIKLVTESARKGKNVELNGATFTISNLGAQGVEYFTPILNPPESGILGVGTFIKEFALGENEAVKQKISLPLSLTFDHRVLDGAPAAAFLNTIAHYLANPYLLLL